MIMFHPFVQQIDRKLFTIICSCYLNAHRCCCCILEWRDLACNNDPIVCCKPSPLARDKPKFSCNYHQMAPEFHWSQINESSGECMINGCCFFLFLFLHSLKPWLFPVTFFLCVVPFRRFRCVVVFFVCVCVCLSHQNRINELWKHLLGEFQFFRAFLSPIHTPILLNTSTE